MRKILALVLCVAMLFSVPAMAEELTGQADGFLGLVTVTVVKEGDDIVSVEVEAASDTPAMVTMAVDGVVPQIVEKDSTEVDVVAKATFTSNGIINAVNNALDPEQFPYVAETEEEVEALRQENKKLKGILECLGHVYEAIKNNNQL